MHYLTKMLFTKLHRKLIEFLKNYTFFFFIKNGTKYTSIGLSRNIFIWHVLCIFKYQKMMGQGFSETDFWKRLLHLVAL
jgi:hypothetical protein